MPGRGVLGEQRAQGRVKAELAWFGIATNTGNTREHCGEAVPHHMLLSLPANWLSPARWILFSWSQLPVLSTGQPEAVPPLLAASYNMA